MTIEVTESEIQKSKSQPGTEGESWILTIKHSENLLILLLMYLLVVITADLSSKTKVMNILQAL